MHFSTLDSYIGKKLLPIHFSQLQKFSGGNFHLFTTIADIALLACILNAVVVMFDREVFCTLLPELSTRVFNWWRTEESVSTQSKKVEYFIVAMQNAAQDANVRTSVHYSTFSKVTVQFMCTQKESRNREKGQKQGTKPRSSNKAKSLKVLRRNLSAKCLIYANFSMFDIL